MKQIYLECLFSGLVKVNCVKLAEPDPDTNTRYYQARVMETKGGYYKGECIIKPARNFVHKLPYRQGIMWVHEVQPDELEAAHG